MSIEKGNMYEAPINNWEKKLEDVETFMKLQIAPGINMSVSNSGTWSRKSAGVIDNSDIRTNAFMYYDIASLTKTVSAIVWLDYLNLSSTPITTPAHALIPLLKNHPHITIEQLLSHQNSLDIRNKFAKGTHYTKEQMQQFFENKDNFIQVFKNLDQPTEYNYKDTAYMLLGFGLEQIFDQPLDTIIHNYLFRNNISGIVFNPAEHSISPQRITQSHGELRKSEVYDPKNRFYGGINGHSGLFATQYGLEQFVSKLLNNEFNIEPQLFQDLFSPKNVPSKDTGLSFSIGCWRKGNLLSNPALVNMSGHTGPFIAIDTETKQSLILTTNITYPENTDSKRAKYRMFLNDLFRDK
jgi:CubicO group peptidase (beta-lactamase class C family)